MFWEWWEHPFSFRNWLTYLRIISEQTIVSGKVCVYINVWAYMSYFSHKWEKKVKVKSLSRVRLFATLWTVAHQAPLSMGFSRQEYWSGLPFPPPGDLCCLLIFWLCRVFVSFWRPSLGAASKDYSLVVVASLVAEHRQWHWHQHPCPETNSRTFCN